MTPAGITAPDCAPPPRGVLTWLWHELRVGVPIGLLAAAFISTMFRNPFGRTLVYSLCIGLSIQFLIEAGRYGLAAWRRRRDPDNPMLGAEWPGWPWMAPWSLGSALAGYYAGSLLGDLLTGTQRSRGPFGAEPHALALLLMVSLGLTFAAVYFFYSRGKLAALQAQSEAAQRNAAETQLKLLQSQLEPHMLFNTLANLRVLIASDPPRAQAMLDRLIAFLRATLGASRSVAHPLAAEFQHLDDYLALMAVRMGPRLAVRAELPAALSEVPVPPLLLQPLVENAIRHGLEPKVHGGRIEIGAQRNGDALLLIVRDTGVGLAPGAGHAPSPGADSGGGPGVGAAYGAEGFGLRQVRERLATLYGARATLTLQRVEDGEGGTLASVRLPLQR